MDATKIWFSEHSKNHSSPPLEGEDIAIWFLVSTVHESDAQHDYESNECQRNPVGRWRLALLVKNTMILGKALDIRCLFLKKKVEIRFLSKHLNCILDS